jgi:hypothetical protein
MPTTSVALALEERHCTPLRCDLGRAPKPRVKSGRLPAYSVKIAWKVRLQGDMHTETRTHRHMDAHGAQGTPSQDTQDCS